MAQNLINSAGNTVLTIEDGTNEETFGLKFTGKNRVEYGEHRNTNILRLAESFASEDVLSLGPSPDVIDNPQLGQVWFDTTANAIRVYTSSGWSTFSNDVRTDVGPFPVSGNQVTLTKNIGGPIIISNVGENTDLVNHISSTTAHEADNISFSLVGFAATNVQDAIEEAEQNLIDHINAAPAHDSSDLTFVPYGSIGSTNAQAAMQELEQEVNALLTDSSNLQAAVTSHIAADPAHAASRIVYNPFGNSIITGTINVQNALVVANAFADTVSESVFEDSVKLICNQLFNGPIGSTATLIPINVVDFGDDLGQVVGGIFTASQDQVVRYRVRFGTGTGVSAPPSGSVLTVDVRRYTSPSTFTIIRTFYLRNNDGANRRLHTDFSGIAPLSAGDQIRVAARLTIPGTARYSQQSTFTSLEIDVLEFV